MRSIRSIFVLALVAGVTALLTVACGDKYNDANPTGASAVGGAAVTSGAVSLDAKKPKVDVCHVTGNGSYNLLNVNGNAQQAHLDHGDGLADSTVGAPAGQKFDEACNLVAAAVCPCGTEWSTLTFTPNASCAPGGLGDVLSLQDDAGSPFIGVKTGPPKGPPSNASTLEAHAPTLYPCPPPKSTVVSPTSAQSRQRRESPACDFWAGGVVVPEGAGGQPATAARRRHRRTYTSRRGQPSGCPRPCPSRRRAVTTNRATVERSR